MRLSCIVRFALAIAVLVALAAPGTALAAPATTDFGSVTAGGVSPTQTVTLTNAGPLALTVGHLAIVGTVFRAVTPLADCEGTIPAGGHCSVLLRFAPPVPGAYRGQITAGGGQALALLTGTAVSPAAATGGIGTALAVSHPAPSSLPKAFAAHVRWHKAAPRHKHKRHARRGKRRRHK